jgi:hypothetical protein
VCATDGPVGIVLEGARGIGKTTLWREAVESARSRGYQVLTTSPGEPDGAPAFVGLGDLFGGVSEDVISGLPDAQRRAVSVALFSRNGGEAPADPQALGRAILGLLDTMAAHRPVVVALDDEQWLDRASARVLAFALRRVREQRISVLLARRPQSGGALWTELSLGFGAKRLIPLVIRPLELSAIQGVVGEQLPVEIPRALVRRIHVASSGNPLFALAIAREVDTDAQPARSPRADHRGDPAASGHRRPRTLPRAAGSPDSGIAARSNAREGAQGTGAGPHR